MSGDGVGELRGKGVDRSGVDLAKGWDGRVLLFFSRPRIPEACRSKSPSLTASCSAKRELRKCLHNLLAIALFLSFTSNKE